jgi:TIR domain-containing protein
MKDKSIFLSHTHTDKPFARRVAADLAALGATVWIDEAELNIGDSLLSKISSAIDSMQFLGVVLSPESVGSSWVQQELEQAMTSQLSRRHVKVLPLLYQKCELPGFLRGKLYADFTEAHAYEQTLMRVARTMGLDTSRGAGGRLFDPYAAEFGRESNIYSRPVRWYCTYCGTGPMPSYNDYICTGCQRNRPYMGGSCTLWGCPKCRQMNLLSATYCEWCGVHLPSAAQQGAQADDPASGGPSA